MPKPSTSLVLPDGYQQFPEKHTTHIKKGQLDAWTMVNCPDALKHALRQAGDAELRLYTQHQIFYEDNILKHTRSSPNWDGGFVTYATCKHLMRTYKDNWVGTWISGLCPAECEANTILFVGCVQRQFESNYHLYHALRGAPGVTAKFAGKNPRGDLYTPKKNRSKSSPNLRWSWHNHKEFNEPENHTRSVEFYKRSEGSTSEREDRLIPKWWRDIEYIHAGHRPPTFILSPCFIFSKPMLWAGQWPGRAALKLTCKEFLAGLRSSPQR